MKNSTRRDIGLAIDKHFNKPEEVENTTEHILNEIMMVEKKWRQ